MPICTSGSSYQEYFLKLDSEVIYCLNPNDDIDKIIELSEFEIAKNLIEFILGFRENT